MDNFVQNALQENIFQVFPTYLLGLITLFLMVVSILFSSIDAAISSLSQARIKTYSKKKTWFNSLKLRYASKKRRVYSICLFANNIFILFLLLLGISFLNRFSLFSFSSNSQFAVYACLMLVVILVCNLVISPVASGKHAYIIFNIMVIPLLILDIILWPINDAIERISGYLKKPESGFEVSINDISDAIDITDKGISTEKDLLEGIVKLKTTDVKKIMKSRVDVVSVSLDTHFDMLKSIIIENVYSRMPVYEGTFDNIKGILFVKDLIPHLSKNTFNWQTLIRPAYYVPQSKRIDDLLEEFQKRKVHMALVIDEYGGTLGIVTMEDILEEIVGEINDEFDEDTQDIVKLSENTFACEGKLALNDFMKYMDLDESFFEGKQGETETLAGLILEIKGDFPILNEEIVFKNLVFKIESEDQRRIKKIKVTIHKNNT